MESIAVKRIQRDLLDITKSETTAPCGVKAELINDSFLELRGEIAGPPDTPYEGGKFELEIKVPSKYPFQPPQVRFLTKVWHVNISPEDGFICLDILYGKWSPALNLRTILLSIQVLLSSPQPDHPQNTSVAQQFIEKQRMFQLTASHWTNVYAGGPRRNKSFEHKIRKMIEVLGVSENECRVLLSHTNWDLGFIISTDRANDTS